MADVDIYSLGLKHSNYSKLLSLLPYKTSSNKPEKSIMTLDDDRIASLDALGLDWTTNFSTTGKSDRCSNVFEVPKEDIVSSNN